MLYRTQNPFTFRFNTLPLVYPPPPPPVAYLSTPVQRMERLEGSFRRSEMEDFLVNNDTTNEDFFVENLLVDGQDVFFEAEKGEENVAEAADETPTPLSVLPEPKPEQSGISTPDVDDFGSVPADEEADLEWLSHFVEDSFSGYSITCQTEKMPENTTVNGNKPVPAQPSEATTTTTPAQTKVRTKRSRTGGRVWSLTGSSSSTTESDTSLVCSGQTADSLVPPAKKKKKRVATAALLGSGVVVRRCTHCGVTKTPQWRLGPLGAKTLCNACGVRFKSGRLLPEYRPACSPTFSSEMHSNNHRKVLEMRMKKEEGIN